MLFHALSHQVQLLTLFNTVNLWNFFESQTVDIDFPNTTESYRLYSQVCDFTVIIYLGEMLPVFPHFTPPTLCPDVTVHFHYPASF
jgi:hypothetical protein